MRKLVMTIFSPPFLHAQYSTKHTNFVYYLLPFWRRVVSFVLAITVAIGILYGGFKLMNEGIHHDVWLLDLVAS